MESLFLSEADGVTEEAFEIAEYEVSLEETLEGSGVASVELLGYLTFSIVRLSLVSDGELIRGMFLMSLKGVASFD